MFCTGTTPYNYVESNLKIVKGNININVLEFYMGKSEK
jgi:hypothetical protein